MPRVLIICRNEFRRLTIDYIIIAKIMNSRIGNVLVFGVTQREL
jgi:hypothetical protein